MMFNRSAFTLWVAARTQQRINMKECLTTKHYCKSDSTPCFKKHSYLRGKWKQNKDVKSAASLFFPDCPLIPTCTLANNYYLVRISFHMTSKQDRVTNEFYKLWQNNLSIISNETNGKLFFIFFKLLEIADEISDYFVLLAD